MGHHIYVEDAKRRDIPTPAISVPWDDSNPICTTRLEAHRFIEKIRNELGYPVLSLERKMYVLEQAWRDQKIDPKEKISIDLDWIVDIINSLEFGRLYCA